MRLKVAYNRLLRHTERVSFHAALDPESVMERPVFILGAYRSGTTLMRMILDSHPRFACPPETDFLDGLWRLQATDDYRRGLSDMGFSEDLVSARIRVFADYFFANFAAAQGKRRWIDKSPVLAARGAWLLKIFPDARFISVVRSPLDQIHSFSANGTRLLRPVPESIDFDPGEDLRVTAARYWVYCVNKQLELEALAPTVVYRVAYRPLVEKPRASIAGVLDFLGEDWDERCLNFWQHPHVFGRQDSTISTLRGFNFSGGHSRTWPAAVRDRCLELVSPTARMAGVDLEYEERLASAEGGGTGK